MSTVVIWPVHFGQGLICYSNSNFFLIDYKAKTNLIARSGHTKL